MTNEDRQRTMDFILQQQAQFAASIQRLGEDIARNERNRPQLEKSFQTVVHLLEIQESRLDRAESRLDRVEFDTAAVERRTSALENSMTNLANAQAHADERLSALINIIMEDRGRSS